MFLPSSFNLLLTKAILSICEEFYKHVLATGITSSRAIDINWNNSGKQLIIMSN